MAVKSPQRQYPLVAELELTLSELATVQDVELPPGAVVLDIKAYVDTAFNAATTNTLSIGDSGSATRYLNAGSVGSAGVVGSIAGFGRKYTTAEVIRFTYAQSGAAASAGALRAYVSYAIAGRANEVQT